MHALFDAHAPTFPTVNILLVPYIVGRWVMSRVCTQASQPPDDSSRMKQAVVRTFWMYEFKLLYCMF